jgi:hypothetical protein
MGFAMAMAIAQSRLGALEGDAAGDDASLASLWGRSCRRFIHSCTSLDGCAILHQQKDGWNMLKPDK